MFKGFKCNDCGNIAAQVYSIFLDEVLPSFPHRCQMQAGAHIRGVWGGVSHPPSFVKYVSKVGPETWDEKSRSS